MTRNAREREFLLTRSRTSAREATQPAG
jgi:hypothetical protein